MRRAAAFVAGSGGGIGEASHIIFNGEQATLSWDGPATSQVRFIETSPGAGQVGADQTAAPYAVLTGNLSTNTYTYDVEVDGFVRAVITVHVLDELAFVANIGTAGGSVASNTLDVVTTAAVDPDSDWIAVRVVCDDLGGVYGVDNGDVPSVVIDPGGANIVLDNNNGRIWERTAGFEGSGVAPFGVTSALFFFAPSAPIPLGTTIRVNFNGAIPARTVSVERFSKDARTVLFVGTTVFALSPLNTRIGTPPFAVASEPDVAQYVWFYQFGREGGAVDVITYAAPWAALTQVTDGSGGFDSVGDRGAIDIVTSLSSGDATPTDPGANTEYATGTVGFDQRLNGQRVPSP